MSTDTQSGLTRPEGVKQVSDGVGNISRPFPKFQGWNVKAKTASTDAAQGRQFQSFTG